MAIKLQCLGREATPSTFILFYSWSLFTTLLSEFDSGFQLVVSPLQISLDGFLMPQSKFTSLFSQQAGKKKERKENVYDSLNFLGRVGKCCTDNQC